MAYSVRWIDAALQQNAEPAQCGWCSRTLNHGHPSLYFCGQRCQNTWHANGSVGVMPDMYRQPNTATSEPDVRYPEANQPARRDRIRRYALERDVFWATHSSALSADQPGDGLHTYHVQIGQQRARISLEDVHRAAVELLADPEDVNRVMNWLADNDSIPPTWRRE